MKNLMKNNNQGKKTQNCKISHTRMHATACMHVWIAKINYNAIACLLMTDAYKLAKLECQYYMITFEMHIQSFKVWKYVERLCLKC